MSYLKPIQKDIINMYYFEDKNTNEIAKELGFSRQYICQEKENAMAQMKRKIKKQNK